MLKQIFLCLILMQACGYAAPVLLIRKPMATNPTTWVLNRSVANSVFDRDLFCTTSSQCAGYTTELNLQTGALTNYHGIDVYVDRCWSRLMYLDDAALDAENYRIRTYGSSGTGLGEFSAPNAVEVLSPTSDINFYNNYYNIYVSDLGNDRIQRLRYRWTTPDSGLIHVLYITNPLLDGPVDIDVNDNSTFDLDGDDIVWVACENNKILSFNNAGTLVNSYGNTGSGIGEFNGITAIVCGRKRYNASTGVYFGNNKFVYVLDAGNDRIVQLEQTLTGIEWRSQYSAPQYLSTSTDLEVDAAGSLWVTVAPGSILKFAINEVTNSMLAIGSFGSEGTDPNQFSIPQSIFCGAGHIGFGEMLICEDWNDLSGVQHYVIATDVVDLFTDTFPYQSHCAVNVTFTLADISQITVSIFNANGLLVKSFPSQLGVAGYYQFFWNGLNQSGAPAPGGQYRAQVRAVSKYRDEDGMPVNQVIKQNWFSLCNPQCSWLVGDANGTGFYNISDAVYLINFIFDGGPAPTPHATGSGDADCSGNVTISDPVYLLSFIFGGGQAPQCTCDWFLK